MKLSKIEEKSGQQERESKEPTSHWRVMRLRARAGYVELRLHQAGTRERALHGRSYTWLFAHESVYRYLITGAAREIIRKKAGWPEKSDTTTPREGFKHQERDREQNRMFPQQQGGFPRSTRAFMGANTHARAILSRCAPAYTTDALKFSEIFCEITNKGRPDLS